jgi:dTDP-glucose pyrophosphorylase
MEIALVYMVAGLSSRFGGKIKQFARVGPNHETLIEYSMNQALPAGFTKIVFVVGNKTEQPFKEMFGNKYKNIPIEYAFQKFDETKRDKPWGTVDAVCAIKEIIDSPFVVCNGDDLYGKGAFKTIIEHIKNSKDNSNATLGYKLKNVIPEQGKTNRGIFELNPNNTIKNLTEVFEIEKSNLKEKNLTPESLCSMNIFAFSQETLSFLNEILEKFKEQNKGNRKIECLLPEEIGNLIKEGKISVKVYPTDEEWLGVTNPEDEEKIKEKIKIKG